LVAYDFDKGSSFRRFFGANYLVKEFSIADGAIEKPE